MKSLCFLLVVLGVAVAQYTTKYDGINIKEVFDNKRLFKNYFECVMGRHKCSPDGAELKEVLPDALKTGCSKCNEVQRTKTREVIQLMLEKFPKEYKEAEAKFDPTKEYRKKNKDLIEKYGLKIDV